MDVCAFVGVAPRGPAGSRSATPQPARVRRGAARRRVHARRCGPSRWRSRAGTSTARLFGGFEGPGRLPYAVASFFEQGGRRAYVVRIVHDYRRLEWQRTSWGSAVGRLRGFVVDGERRRLLLRAGNEGTWGNGLRMLRLSFEVRPLPLCQAAPDRVVVSPGAAPRVGTLLRLRLSGGALELRIVESVEVHKIWPWR